MLVYIFKKRCSMQNKEIVLLAARCADEKKAENIKVLDLNGLSSLCDYIILATVTSKPHLEAVEDEISTRLKQEGVYKLNRDGGESMMWRVADYGAFLVHIMTQEARDFYALDKIFSFGKELDYKKPKAAKKTTSKAAKKTVKKAVKKVTQKTSAKAPAKKTAKPAVKKTAPKTATKKSTRTTTKKAVKKTAKKAGK